MLLSHEDDVCLVGEGQGRRLLIVKDPETRLEMLYTGAMVLPGWGGVDETLLYTAFLEAL